MTTSPGGEKAEGVLEQGGRGEGRPEAQVQLHDAIGCKRIFFVAIAVASSSFVVLELLCGGALCHLFFFLLLFWFMSSLVFP